MKYQKPDAVRARALRDLAVLAIARHGTLERSGNTKLAVLVQDDLMIGYHTPFNPLPALSDSAKYIAAVEGKARDAYGIEIWLTQEGKVFSAGWTAGDKMNLRMCKPGAWQSQLEDIAAPRRTEKTGRAPQAEKIRQLHLLEQENKDLRRAISGLLRNTLAEAKTAAGKP